MAKIFNQEMTIVDFSKGSPIHIRKTRINFKELVKRILVIALVALLIFFIGSAAYYQLTAPAIYVHCTNANILVFQDENDEYLAYVGRASDKQLEEILRIPHLVVDPSVEDFKTSVSDVESFEIRVNDKNGRSDSICYPSENCTAWHILGWNHTSSEEVEELVKISSEETQFIFNELRLIFYSRA